MSVFSALVPRQETLICRDENWLWPELQREQEAGYHALAPHKYKIKDLYEGILQFTAVVTQKDEDGFSHAPYSSATIGLRYLDFMTAIKLLSLPDLRRVVFLSPTDGARFVDERQIIISSVVNLLRSLGGSLQSIVLPLDPNYGMTSILSNLKHHGGLIQLELALPSTFPVADGHPDLEMSLCLGLHELQQLQKIVLPSELLTYDLLAYLGRLENLKYLKVKPMSAGGGDRFIDLVYQHNISSVNSFYALRQLDLDIPHTDPSKFSILFKRFPGIEYL